MPCNSDYLAASGQELESKRVCGFLIYVFERLDKIVPWWVTSATKEYYGNVARLDEATKMLCETCRSLTSSETEKIIYDAHDKDSRGLADWWERHQEWDRRRVKEEEETRKKIILQGRALKKLSVEEIEALGLKSENDLP